MRRKHVLSVLMLSMGVALLVAAMTVGAATSATQKAGSAKALRGGVLRVAHSGGGFDTLDPQIQYVANDAALLYATQTLLLNFPNKAGKAGTILRPDGAVSMPTISKNGKVYTFHIRKNLRFSDGSPVLANAWQRAFERVLSPQQYVQNACVLYIDKMIVGGEKFANCPGTAGVKTSAHISGIKAKGRTLVFHLTKPNPTFLAILGMPWFGAVKPNMPYSKNPNGVLTYPSAGPYYIAQNQPQRLAVLKRNKYYNGFQEHNPNQIVIQENDGGGEAQVLQIEKGQIDTDFGQVPSDQVSTVAKKYGGPNKSQFHVGSTTCITWASLNTARAPTNVAAARKALSYALGRAPIVKLLGPYAGRPADQFLVPVLPCYKKLNIYPNYPNFAKARKVGAGHLNGTLNLYYRPSSTFQSNLVQFEQREFGLLGFKTNLQASDPSGYYHPLMTRSIATGPNGFNVAGGGWCADYLDPFDYMNANLDGRTIADTGNVNYFYFNNAKWNKAMDHAASLFGKKRAAAYAALDKTLMTKYVPFIPYLVSNNRFLTSKRVKNYLYSAYYNYPVLQALSVSG
jgi:peptide/nickel transport system substrate-binding protein